MGATNQDDRVVRLSYHQRSHYNSVIPKDAGNSKAWILSDTLGYLEDIAFAGREFHEGADPESDELSPEMIRLQNSGHTIDQIRSAVEASRRGFAEEFQRDLDSVLEESRRMYEESNNSEFLEEQKAIEESKRIFEGGENENIQINQAIRESLQFTEGALPTTNPTTEEDEIQAAMLVSAMSSLSTEAYNRSELAQNPIVIQCVQLGFSEDAAIQALMQFGHNQDAVLDYLFSLNIQD